MIELEIVSINEGFETMALKGVGLSIIHTHDETGITCQYILTMNYSTITVHICPLGSLTRTMAASRHSLYIPVNSMMREGQYGYLTIISELMYGYLSTVIPEYVRKELGKYAKDDITAVEVIADAIHYIANMNYLEIVDAGRYKHMMELMSNRQEATMLGIADNIQTNDIATLCEHIPLVMATFSESAYDDEELDEKWQRVYQISTRMTIYRTSDLPAPMTIEVQLSQMD